MDRETFLSIFNRNGENWFAKTGDNCEIIAAEVVITDTEIRFGFGVRIRPSGEVSMSVNGRNLGINHGLFRESAFASLRGKKPTWQSAVDIIQLVKRSYYPCGGVAIKAEDCAPAVAGHYPSSTTCSRVSQSERYSRNCPVLVRRPIRGRTWENCSLCRQLYGNGKGTGTKKATMTGDGDTSISKMVEAEVQESTKCVQIPRRSLAEQCLEIMESSVSSDQSSITSIADTLLRQQFKAYMLNDKRGMRWDRTLVDWALRLHVTSAAAYEFLIESGALRLPDSRTLRRYLSKLPKCHGFNDTIIIDIIAEYLNTCQQPYAKYLALSLDEMKIRANLVYDKKAEIIVGYVDSTEMINSVNETDSSVDQSQKIATDVLVVYLRGIGTGFERAIGWFPVRRLSSGEIMSIVWTAKRKLEFLSIRDGVPRLKVVTVTCDGLSANHLFFKLHSDDRHLQYKAIDPFDPANFVYFIIDPPHLVKTIRNNLEKSAMDEEATKVLENGGKCLLWRHIEKVYLDDQANVWRKLPKLSHRHVYLTPSDHMKVKLAVQVLSRTMGAALAGSEETEETAKLCMLVNQMFDILNGRHPEEHLHRRNSDLAPFTSPSDPRLAWLLDVFLVYFDRWEDYVYNLDLSKSEKERRLLSHQTRAGIYITINGVVESTRWLLSQPDAPPYILTSVFNQDRLEIYFGHVRNAGGSSDHPDWSQFRRIASALTYVKSSSLKALRGANVS